VCTINGTTPDYFSTLYQTKGYVQKATGKNQIGFNNFLGEIPIRPDTKQFLSRYRLDAIPRASEYKFVDITSGPSQDTSLTPAQAESGISIKANLDIQTIISQTYPIPVTTFSTNGTPPEIPDTAAGDPPGNEPYLV